MAPGLRGAQTFPEALRTAEVKTHLWRLEIKTQVAIHQTTHLGNLWLHPALCLLFLKLLLSLVLGKWKNGCSCSRDMEPSLPAALRIPCGGWVPV